MQDGFAEWLTPIYLRTLSCNGTISFVLHILSLYLILWRTPKEMVDFRVYLLNTSIVSFVHDIHLSLLWRVVPILPVLGGYVTGPLRIFGDVGGHIGLVVVVVLVVAYVVSVLNGLLYRLFSLMNNRFFRFMKTPVGIAAMLAWQWAWAGILGAFMAVSYVPSSVVREQASQLNMQFDDTAVFGYDILLNFGIVRFFAVAVFSGVIVIPAIIAAIFYALHRNLRALRTVMSLKTYALHRNLIFSLGIQAVSPFVMILYPLLVAFLVAVFVTRNVTGYIEITLMLCTLHSVLDNIVVIVFIKPYRRALLEILRKMFRTKVYSDETTTVSQSTPRVRFYAVRRLSAKPSIVPRV